MPRQNVFVVHASNNTKATNFIAEASQQFPELRIVSLAQELEYGAPVPLELERVSSQMDAAIIIASPDDVGGDSSEESMRPRARQNIWLELGWFWSKIGRSRTLILRQRSVEMPSDANGVFAPVFESSPSELMGEVEKFLDIVSAGDQTDLSEVVYSSSNSDVRLSQFNEVLNSAEHELWISGIGMNSMRHTIRKIASSKILETNEFKLHLLTPTPDFVRNNHPILGTLYRNNLHTDIETFTSAVSSLEEEFPHLKNRIELRWYSGIMPFVITAADPAYLGGTMIAEMLPPMNSKIHIHERPRLYLRRRSYVAVYESFWASFLTMWENGVRQSG